MKVAVVGSRDIVIENIGDYIPSECSEIVSGGAKGIDTCAKEYASNREIEYIEILPEYEKYGRSAPLKRNIEIIERVDLVIIFWDGKSKGTNFTIKECKKRKINYILNKILVEEK